MSGEKQALKHRRTGATTLAFIVEKLGKLLPVRGDAVAPERVNGNDSASRHLGHCGFSPEERVRCMPQSHSQSILLLPVDSVKGMVLPGMLRLPPL